jgi:cold shock CspA family protein
VLVTSDGDYASLIRKLKLQGMHVVLLSWDFEYITNSGKKTGNRTSQELLEEATYPIAMHQLIDNRLIRNEPLIAQLFVPWEPEPTPTPVPRYNPHQTHGINGNTMNGNEIHSSGRFAEDNIGTILSINGTYGFIRHPNYMNNLYFHSLATVGIDFHSFKPNDEVYFEIGTNSRGETIAQKVSLRI